MKVKVHTIRKPYDRIETASLRAILRNHAHDRLRCPIKTEQLYDIMGELAKRRQASGDTWRTNEEGVERVCAAVLPCGAERRTTHPETTDTHTLTPSFHGAECLGNGDWIGYECQCDECPYFLQCFPESE